MSADAWVKLDKCTLQHENKNRVVAFRSNGNLKYEVWYLVNGKYRHGGIHEDFEIAKQAASKGIQDAGQ